MINTYTYLFAVDGIDFQAASWGVKDPSTPAWELEEIVLENAHLLAKKCADN